MRIRDEEHVGVFEPGEKLLRIRDEAARPGQGNGHDLRPALIEQPGAPRRQRGGREDFFGLERDQDKIQDLGRAVTEEDVFRRDALLPRDEAPQVAGPGVGGRSEAFNAFLIACFALAEGPRGLPGA